MSISEVRCPKCGSVMYQTGSEHQTAIYHCRSCGFNEYIKMAVEDNADYLHKRSMLLGRVRKGIVDWEITQWETLKNEIMDFTIAYHAARNDIYFKMATIACLTQGFHFLDDKRYKECKRIFKITEKVYKQYSKHPGAVPSEMSEGSPLEYEEYRNMYKKCKYDYKNTKLVYKLLLKLGMKIIPVPKL